MCTDVHSIGSNSDSFLEELSLALRSCANLSHQYEVDLGNGQDVVQQSTELVRSSVDLGSENPELTSECLYGLFYATDH
jgi:hypothetical protein